MRLDRRRLLQGTAAVAAGGVGSLAGCADGGGDSEPGIPVEPNYRDWFDNVSNYTTTKDRRNEDATTVKVGVSANNGKLGFGPPAIAISPDTEVVWDWTGDGGEHNVVSRTSLFDSGDPVRAGSTTFEHTFERPGIFKYVCEPHASIGMKGAVFVALE